MKIAKKALKKIILEQITNKITAKSGGDIWRVMERHNPQLGIYYVFDLVKIAKVGGNSIYLNNNEIYDKFTGESKSNGTAAYGTNYFKIMNHDNARKYFNELKSSGKRVSGFKD